MIKDNISNNMLVNKKGKVLKSIIFIKKEDLINKRL
jgi:hypothetical protein